MQRAWGGAIQTEISQIFSWLSESHTPPPTSVSSVAQAQGRHPQLCTLPHTYSYTHFFPSSIVKQKLDCDKGSNFLVSGLEIMFSWHILSFCVKIDMGGRGRVLSLVRGAGGRAAGRARPECSCGQVSSSCLELQG